MQAGCDACLFYLNSGRIKQNQVWTDDGQAGTTQPRSYGKKTMGVNTNEGRAHLAEAINQSTGFQTYNMLPSC